MSRPVHGQSGVHDAQEGSDGGPRAAPGRDRSLGGVGPGCGVGPWGESRERTRRGGPRLVPADVDDWAAAHTEDPKGRALARGSPRGAAVR